MIRDNLQLFIPKVTKIANPPLLMKLKNAVIDLSRYAKDKTAIYNVSHSEIMRPTYIDILGRLTSERGTILALESELPYNVMKNSYNSTIDYFSTGSS
jgi:hypothetical protein